MSAPGRHPAPAPRRLRARTTVSIGLVLLLLGSSLGLPIAHPSPSGAPGGAAASALTQTALALTNAAGAPTVLPASASSPWRNLTPTLTLSPSAREGGMMAYDPTMGGVILFGGLSGNRSDSDTWLFASGHWTDLTSTLGAAPPPRYHGGLVFDIADNELILFGGQSGSGYHNDTWAFNGTAWTLLHPTQSPGPREDVMMAYDTADQYVLLFGGEATLGNFDNDTWTFSAGEWTNRTSSISVAPPAREAGGFTYDGPDHYALLFSGKRGVTGLWNDTWSYSGGVWRNLTANLTVSPPPRESMSLAYDFVDGFVLLFGGFRFPNSYNDEWVFQNGNWSEKFPPMAPTAREDTPMAYFPNLGFGFVLIFGGRSSPNASGEELRDTWSYKVPLTVVASAAPSTIDLGESTHLSASATGGYPPYGAYGWAGLPPGCSAGAGATNVCTPSANGTYTIQANATDSSGTNGTGAPAVVLVNPDPSVTANESVASGEIPLAVSFSAAILGGTAPFQYSWLFGDGGASAAAAPSHTYGATGTFSPALTITDARNFTASVTLPDVNVSAPPVALSATLMASPTSGTFPLTVDFEIDASGGEAPYSYAWNFGVSGATATSATTSYTYTTAGTFDVSVVVSDAAYEHVTQTTQVVVSTPVPLAAHAQATARGVAPLKVELTGSASGGTGPYAYAWTIGSVLAASTAVANYTITTPGTYTVVLAVTDANGTTALASAQVLVLAPLTAAFAWTVGTPYCSQGTGVANVTLNATASGGYGGPVYNWSFPNGAGSGANTTVILPAGATSTLVLSVSDSDHNTAQATHSVSVASVSCSTPSGSISAPVDLLLLLLIVLVAVVVAVEAVLLLRRKKK